LAILRAENVVARRYFWPGCHRCSPFNESASGAEALPVTERLLGELLQLPTGLQLDADAAFSMGRLVALAIQHAPRLRRSIPCLET
jgi:dTDP-4-amino-4,6-dideoxygalactose transaminase